MAAPLYLCVHLRDFAVQARHAKAYRAVSRRMVPAAPTQAQNRGLNGPSASGREMNSLPVVVLSGQPPLERVFAANTEARQLGVGIGMSRVQAESFAVKVLVRERGLEDAAFAALVECVQQFSPRVETIASPAEESCGATLVLDVSGCERLFGDARKLTTTARRAIAALGFAASLATAQNAWAAVLAARGNHGTTLVAPGREAATLAQLGLDVLELEESQSATFAGWGIHTLGELAALPARALAARIGQSGVRMQAQARGEYEHLLAPDEKAVDAAIGESVELEHPVELLEPLLFLVNQLLEQILRRADERALAIASLECCLTMLPSEHEASVRSGAPPSTPAPWADKVEKQKARGYSNPETALDAHIVEQGTKTALEHRRTVRPALPERERLTLLKLIQLDLEMHPPVGAIKALRLTAYPARVQVAQQGLFAAQAPESGKLEILLARLRKLVGAERVGSPELLDTHAPESFRLTSFLVGAEGGRHPPSFGECGAAAEPPANAASALRMVRPPRAVEVELRGEEPLAVHYEGRRLQLQSGSGPWRSSGAWWTNPSWCREEWDVVLREQPERCLRLAHDPGAGCWYLIGVYD